MKLKFKGLKIEVEEFELEESLHPNVLIGYKEAIKQIGILLSKEKDIEKIKERVKFLHDYPNV